MSDELLPPPYSIEDDTSSLASELFEPIRQPQALLSNAFSPLVDNATSAIQRPLSELHSTSGTPSSQPDLASLEEPGTGSILLPT